MMFFQVVLLLGYAYAHLLRRFLSPRNAWLVHAIVLGVAACFAQIVPAENLQPTGGESLTLMIITTLATTIGLPFFALATTGPLVQAWQSTSHEGRSPYRLYALSNLGSMLALISYPFVIEVYFPLLQQAKVWSIGFLLFAGLCVWSGWQTIRQKEWSGESSVASSHAQASVPGLWWQPFVWVLLAATASVMLLATTNLMCQEVASVPFLWILPLVLYLLSFIICFERPALYRRRIFTPLLVASSFFAIAIVHLNVFAGLLLQVAGLAVVCFAASMTCLGELERLKPSAKRLTWFYLLVAFGGSLGGIFVAVVAPHLFSGFFEFQIGLLCCLLVAFAVLYFETKATTSGNGLELSGKSRVPRWVAWPLGGSILLAATFAICSLMYFIDPSYHPGLVYKSRNEYGLVSVIDQKLASPQSDFDSSGTFDEIDYRVFVNGRIEHGGQFLDDQRAMEHSAYYVGGSGVGLAFDTFRAYLRTNATSSKRLNAAAAREEESPLRSLNVGILGLGAGGMVTWSEVGDEFVFYEINPEVETIARDYFTYLSDGKANSSVVLGDGRVQLQRRVEQTTAGPAPRFDLLFMDAFSSDSIPVHLVTDECFRLYCRNLADDGILIAHITNRFVDLRPVIHAAAIRHGLTPILINHISGDTQTRWVLMTKNQTIIDSDIIAKYRTEWPAEMKPVLWTDDYSSLASLLDWSGAVDWEKLKQGRQ